MCVPSRLSCLCLPVSLAQLVLFFSFGCFSRLPALPQARYHHFSLVALFLATREFTIATRLSSSPLLATAYRSVGVATILRVGRW